MQPEFVGATLTGMLHNLFGQRAGDALSAVIRVRGDVGDQVDAFAFVTEGHQAGIADDAPVLFPNETGEWHGCALNSVGGPAHERGVTAGASHLPHVRLAIAVHAVGKTQLNQVGYAGQVAQDIQRAQVFL